MAWFGWSQATFDHTARRIAFEHDAAIDAFFDATGLYILPFMPSRARAVMDERACDLTRPRFLDPQEQGVAVGEGTRAMYGNGQFDDLVLAADPVPVRAPSAARLPCVCMCCPACFSPAAPPPALLAELIKVPDKFSDQPVGKHKAPAGASLKKRGHCLAIDL